MFSCFLNYFENHKDTSFPQSFVSHSNLRLMLNIPDCWFHRQKKKTKKTQAFSKYKIWFWIVWENSWVWAQHAKSYPDCGVIPSANGIGSWWSSSSSRPDSHLTRHGGFRPNSTMIDHRSEHRCLQLPFIFLIPRLFLEWQWYPFPVGFLWHMKNTHDNGRD